MLQSLAQAFVSASRPVRGATFVFIDEAQLALTPATTRTLETLVATVRQFGVALWFVNQSLVQLPREFIHLLSTNLTYRFLGRSGREDGALSTAFLPRPVRATARGQRVGGAREGTPREDSEEALLARLGSLPSRHFYVTDRTTTWGAQEVEVARFAPPSRERLPALLRTALARGATGRPRAELIAEGAALEARTMATLEATAPAPSSRIGRRAPSTATPDVASLGRRWGRRSS